MESSVKIKNIFSLILFFLLGLCSGFLISTVNDGYIEAFLQVMNGCSNLELVEEQEIAISQQQDEIPIPSEDPCPVRVDVSGAVKKPGVYCLDEGSAIVDAIKKTGGLADGYSDKYFSMRINLAKIVQDNSKLYIPFQEDSMCEIIEFDLPKEVINVIEEEPQNSPEEGTGCTSINSATLEQLDLLTGIGPSTAQKIIEGRPYQVIEDLLNVSGIGDSTLSKIRDQICL